MSCVLVVGLLLISLSEPRGVSKVWRTLQALSVLSDDQLRSHYLPSRASPVTTWKDDACPTILVHGNLLVAGSLLVKGRIQVLASANLSSFEATSQLDSALVKTHRMSKFLLNRCSRESPTCNISNTECPFRGDLVLPSSSLIVAGGSLTVLGTVASDGLFVDNAAEVSVGGAGILGPQRVKSLLHETPHADSLCEGERPGKQRPALLIPRGMLYLKNAARLWTLGKVVVSVVGLDRASFWMARCGDLETKGPADEKGDMALLATSKFVKTGRGVVDLAQLVVSETSDFLLLDGSLFVRSILKVSLRSKLEVWAGRLEARNVFLSDGAEVAIRSQPQTAGLDVTEGLVLLDSSVLEVTCSRLGGPCVRVESLEVFDYSHVVVLAAETVVSLVASAAVTLDGGVLLKTSGSVVVEGTLFMSNMSKVEVGGELAVKRDAIAKNGVAVSVEGDMEVECSVWLEQGSKVRLGQSLRVRTAGDFAATCGEGNQSPVLFMTNSEIVAGQRVLLGTRKTVERLIAILLRSSISAWHFAMTTAQSQQKRVLLLRKMSTMQVFGDEKKKRDYSFLGGTYCSLESGSVLQLRNLGIVRLGTVDVVDRSVMASNGSESVAVEFLGLQMNSRADFEAGSSSSLTFARAVEIEGNSQLRVHCAGPCHLQLGGAADLPPGANAFDHLLVSTGSYLELGIPPDRQRATSRSRGALKLEGMWVAQDRSVIVLNAATDTSSPSFDLSVETYSAVYFNFPIVSPPAQKSKISRTLDSQVVLLHQELSADSIRVYSLVVPPSNAADLESFFRTSPLRSKSKNSFWNRQLPNKTNASDTDA